MELNGKPGDERGIIHRRLAAGVGGFFSGGPAGAVTGFLGAGGGGASLPFGTVRDSACPSGMIFGLSRLCIPIGSVIDTACASGWINATSRLCVQEITPGVGLGPCKDPDLVRDPDGQCRFPGSPSGGIGEARMGQFGAALEPSFFTINQRRCLPGMILGKDKLCYNVGAISNKERLWPKGAAPLLTGGEMSAIRKAATAAGKFQRAGKRLAAVGKTFSGPAGRRAAAPRRLTAGKTVKVLESGPGSVQL